MIIYLLLMQIFMSLYLVPIGNHVLAFDHNHVKH